MTMPDQEKDKQAQVVPAENGAGAPSAPSGKPETGAEDDSTHHFFGEPLVGFDPSEITGNLVVIEGMDGSGRSIAIVGVRRYAAVDACTLAIPYSSDPRHRLGTTVSAERRRQPRQEDRFVPTSSVAVG